MWWLQAYACSGDHTGEVLAAVALPCVEKRKAASTLNTAGLAERRNVFVDLHPKQSAATRAFPCLMLDLFKNAVCRNAQF